MRKNNIRAFKDVANIIVSYSEKRELLMDKISTGSFEKSLKLGQDIETTSEKVDFEKNIRRVQDKTLNFKRKKISAFLQFKKQKNNGGQDGAK
jgi:hypothetical protein